MLIKKFEEQVKRSPGKIAIKAGALSFSYDRLNRDANRVGHILTKRWPEDRKNNAVGLFLEHGPQMIAAILGTLKAGKFYVPLSTDYPENRLSYMLSNSESSLIVTNSEYEERAKSLSAKTGIDLLVIDKEAEAVSEQNPARELFADELAYIMYTSGSTGRPKGVTQIHKNVLYYTRNWTRVFAITSADNMTLFSSFCHDGSVQDLFGALLNGATLFPVSIRDREEAFELSDFLVREKITIWHSVPSLYSYFTNTLTGMEDFKKLRLILLGGEAVREHEVAVFKKYFPHSQLANVYGQTESSVDSIRLIGQDDSFDEPLIGEPLDETAIFVIDEDGGEVDTLQTGEILIACPYISPGYWKNEEASEKAFSEDEESGRLYRTGDRGRLLPGGGIVFMGRQDHQVKIRGFRIELGEIETRLLAHEDIKEAVVLLKGDGRDDNFLVAYYAADSEIPSSLLREFSAGELPDYMVPTFYMRLAGFPLTQSGKIDRNALPEPEIVIDEKYTAPQDKIEQELAGIWSGVLGIEEEKIGTRTSFFELGGHSLRATAVVSIIHKRMNVRVPLAELFRRPTIKDIARYISGTEKEQHVSIKKAGEKPYYSLSSAQRRLFILERMGSLGTTYNMPRVVKITGSIDKDTLKRTFNSLIERHESLRTSFYWKNEEPVQHIHDPREIEFEIEYYDVGNRQEAIGSKEEQKASTVETQHLASQHFADQERRGEPCVPPSVNSADEVIARFIRPFDLSRAPLLRVGLIKIEKEEQLLSFDMHHIISDGVSGRIFIEEFMTLYRGEPLSPLRIQYKDFSEWRNSKEQQAAIKRQESYWLEQFAGEVPVLNLPGDFPRPAVQSFAGSTVSFELGPEEAAALNRVALEQETTLFMVLVAVFNVLLSRLSGQEDIVIGTPTAGRRHTDTTGIIGIFVNTLGIRSFPIGEKTFGDFLQEVKQTTLNAFENQEYQFEDLVEEVEVNRDVSRNPLFDVMFTLQNMENPEIEIPSGLKLGAFAYKRGAAKFDLTLYCIEFGEKIGFGLEYCTKLFKEETIDKFINYFKILTGEMTADPHKKISDMQMIPEEEMRQVLFEFNDTGAPYEGSKTISRLFAEQAEKKPDHIAIIGTRHKLAKQAENTLSLHPVYLTYGKLAREVYGLTRVLRQKGTGPGTIAAIMVERSLEMMVGIFAILKAGGAYLPIDPYYPQSRQEYILWDSNAGLLLTARAFEKEVDKLNVGTIFIEAPASGGPPHMRGEAFSRFAAHSRELIACTLNGPPRRGASGHLDALRPLETGRKGEPCVPPPMRAVPEPGVGSGPAYVIYTSGSTGLPKGVMIEHHSVVNRLSWMQKGYPLSSGDIILQKTTYTFDVSVWELFWWSFYGAGLCLLVPGGEKDPAAIIAAVIKYNVSTMHFVPSMLDTFLHYVDMQENPVHLPALRQVFASGEALKPEQVATFNRLLYEAARTKLINLYGPTEATVDVSYFNCYGSEKLDRIPIGKPIDNIQLYILDRALHVQPLGVAGQLFIAGAGLGRGYINRPELTSEKFIASGGPPFCKKVGPKTFHEGVGLEIPSRGFSGAAPRMPRSGGVGLVPTSNFQLIYQTGDLARWLADGNIEYLGRIDNQVKIRGFRIELGEIENRLAEHTRVKQAVVIDKPAPDGDRYLVAYVAAELEIEDELREYLAEALPDYMVPARFVFLEQIPLTPNGKVDRKALPEPRGHTGEQDYTAPRDGVEKKLVEIWSEVLGIDRQKIGIDNNFFHLGGHSLKATQMAVNIQKILNVNVPLEQVFKTPALRGLAEFVKSASHYTFYSINSAEKKEYYPLSSSQKRLYVLQQIDHGSSTYNIPNIMTLTGEIDLQKFRETFKKLIDRHESLRTSFLMAGGEPVQRVYDARDIEFDIEPAERASVEGPTGHLDASRQLENDRRDLIHQTRRTVETKHLASQHSEEQERRGEPCVPPPLRPETKSNPFIRSFDLAKAPLLRVGLMETGADTHILAVDMHHIISDGVSGRIFVEEFMTLYLGEYLSPLRVQYKDFSEWRNSKEQQETIKQQETYWLEQFAGEVPVLNLPGDFPRPPVQSFVGSRVTFEIGAEETAALNRLALDREVTLFMILLSVFNVLLSRLSGQEDIVIGTPTAGRRHVDIGSIIGLFINTLGMRNLPIGEKTFGDFLQEVKHTTLTAFENQEYKFEDLVENVEVNRDVSRNPVFDVLLVLQNMENPEIEIPSGLKLGAYDFESGIAKFDLSLYGAEISDKLGFVLEYCTKLFKEKTIAKFINYFKTLISEVTADPGKKMNEFRMVPEEEMRQVLYDFNDTGISYDEDKTLARLFEEQAARTPDQIVIAGKKYPVTGQDGDTSPVQTLQLTYLGLEEKSGIIGSRLREKGVAPDIITGLLVERSVDMVTGLLGILKAGGAYLPIDPEYPPERIDYMLRESRTQLLLTTRRLVEDVEKPASANVETVFIEEIGSSTVATQNLASQPFDELASGGPLFEKSGAKTFDEPCRPGRACRDNMSYNPLPDGLAYVIYTSGSTGKPKGVALSHRNVVNFIKGMTEVIDFSPGRTILAVTTICFDIFVLEILLPLVSGLKFVIADEIEQKVPNQLARLIVKNGIDMLQFTPSRLNLLLSVDKKLECLAGVGDLMVGGEAFPGRLFSLLKEKYKGNIHNMYGPTETAVWSAVKNLTGVEKINIGSPIANTQIYIVDKTGSPQPAGIPGELCIGGDGLARGYINRPELTHEKFSWSFFQKATPRRGHHEAGDSGIPENQSPVPLEGARAACYKTGDLARWLPDGEIEFLGRMDYQVKIRGFRIELGEIENALKSYGEKKVIREAVVIDRADGDGVKRLSAYIVSLAEVTVSELRSYLSGKLPDYMIPSYFVQIETLPLTPNGKIDKKALDKYGKKLEGGTTYQEPRNAVEERIAAIWQEFLKLDRVGIHDNYFELGGTSLDIIKVNVKLQEAFQKEIPVVAMFRYTTVHALAGYLGDEQTTIRDREKEVKKGKQNIQALRKRIGVKNG